MNLEQLGWNEFFEPYYTPEADSERIVGRIACATSQTYLTYTPQGNYWAITTGRMRYLARNSADLPAVGDWVILKPTGGEQQGIIEEVLPRKSKFSRQAAGEIVQEQIIATNIDTIFLVVGLDGDFNLRRIERYLIQVRESGANPVILLNKADLHGDSEHYRVAVESVALDVPILLLSATCNQGLESLHPYLNMGQTVALVGSSGAGKSTLINQLIGRQRQAVREVRQDDSKGRHTTTRRELISLPAGGLLVDTPGMRELQTWRVEGGLSETFAEIEDLATQCRFRNCQHESEPNCAVQEAISEGTLDPKRWRSYKKLQREAKFSNSRQEKTAALVEKEKWKKIHQVMRKRNKL
ncbi:ribosome small subunit-dependent GTPase A [Lusitaniella coriacea LEGE 07157]|uniref:Small ribosomal subunit biogenesis GTPase RsgA n=1 Tax=Lusitaniella coriacea LEGE 07157 TaxID=945747 RepID=A0A8J7B8W4_9CYAN|nr:ribosome small subunit-dependent GTPase A [Lusitaniella coriacea]MBE9115318.1 ribosome small subunit-dependent GTPase A [Lusitaniella coriacea LEGE 07157]